MQTAVRSTAGVILLSLLGAGTVFAAVSPETFSGDLTDFEEELGHTVEEQENWLAEQKYQASDFFPHIDGEEGTPVEEPAGTTSAFTDVPADSWFARYAADMAEQRIMEGYKDAAGNPLGLFGPADDVTIEQIAKMAVISARVDQSKCPTTAKNEQVVGRWSAGFISCAEQLGWQVFADGAVDPARPALRSEVVTTVLEAFGRELEPATGTLFKDVSESMPARHAIETAAKDGIVSGFTDSNGTATGFFGPFANVNRAETAKIFSLALETYGL
jgi:hypothetical protein